MIKIRNLTKSHGTFLALNDVSIDIEGEEFVSLVGPSGAGKSTLLHILIGDDKPESGVVSIDGVHLFDLSKKELSSLRKKIGVVLQQPSLLPNKTAFENVAFPLEIGHHKKPYILARTLEVLHTVHMEEKKEMFPHQLSGGERQKVAIARAIVNNPKLLIADEPTGNLDLQSTQELLEILEKINKDGTTIILATHNFHIVDMLQKRVVLLRDGRVVTDEKHASYPA